MNGLKLTQPEPPCKTGSQCVGGKCERCAVQPEPEPVAWMYEYGTDRCDAVNTIRWYPNVTALRKPEGMVRNVVPLYTAPPQREWQNAALRIGEDLSSVGPDGYYEMTAEQWLDWAMSQNPKGKTSLPQREWVGLTEDDLDFWGGELGLGELGKGVLRAVADHLKEKNNGRD